MPPLRRQQLLKRSKEREWGVRGAHQPALAAQPEQTGKGRTSTISSGLVLHAVYDGLMSLRVMMAIGSLYSGLKADGVRSLALPSLLVLVPAR